MEHGHGHGHGAPLTELNETQVLQDHGPTPLSFYDHDIGMTYAEDGVKIVPVSPDSAERTYPTFMILHVICMSLAFFAILPIGIVLRNAKHKYHIIAQSSFIALVAVGWFFSTLYRSLTPNLYPGESHTPLGYVVLLGVVAIAGYDCFRVLVRLYQFVTRKSSSGGGLWKSVFKAEESASPAEYEPFHPENQHELEHLQGLDDDDADAARRMSSSPEGGDYQDISLHDHNPSSRRHEQEEIGDVEEELPKEESSKWSRFLAGSVYIGQWALVALAYVELVTGVIVYSGICRATYGNGCLAHMIKGSIFFIYGVVTFCRFLGAFTTFGWAWNRAPTTTVRTGNGAPKVKPNPMPSAEMLECFTIFLYGITNTWLERQGAHYGDPFSTRQIQHISIAVMYWFGGLVGMALESSHVRKLLALSAYLPGSRAMLPAPTGSSKYRRHGMPSAVTGLGEPASYTGSFNPIPALVIGMTGAAMAAHQQEYQYAVSVHMLWGNLLTGFAVLRCMTYIFLWLRPPTAELSVLPSRPPTEALASILLACGGLVFMSSTEEVEFAMMRAGHDDVMMLLNLVLSITCIVFCWCVVTLCIKGWARNQSFSERSDSNSSFGHNGDIMLPMTPRSPNMV
ncbi:hypothetical protein DL93DRAFT_2050842 [Clavulina sp. PMI_390]|nr:hypothetical protein DL93DRAFT_2050842 [Clavulina sp. PMI_390]